MSDPREYAGFVTRAIAFAIDIALIDLAAATVAVVVGLGLSAFDAPHGFVTVAVLTNDTHAFVLFKDGGRLGFFDLPVYADGSGRAKQVALTPFAAASSLTANGQGIGIVPSFRTTARQKMGLSSGSLDVVALAVE